ncbi:MAG: ATP-binding protein [Clostridia bacterium]|nr:ATP-binding protein [Clostridia bacterium]
MIEKQLRSQLRALCITRGLLHFEPVKKFLQMLDTLEDSSSTADRISSIGAYAASLLPYNMDLATAMLDFLKSDRNVYVENILAGRDNQALEAMLKAELELLTQAASVAPQLIASRLPGYRGYLPIWQTGSHDIQTEYCNYLKDVRTAGFGMFRGNYMFALGRRHVYPVSHPDPVRLSDLHGYERQRSVVLRNTRLLLEGGTASNVLLYGDSGTGKSTTVKAVANELGPEGLRLVEVRKSQIHRLPRLLDELGREPLKFVVFIDDLSFTDEDDNFGSLKAILEGSVQSRAANVVIYATSNRRRMIRETFSERGDDDIHANETVQQKTALSDRFGITLAFTNPKRDDFLQMVRQLAGDTDVPEEELFAGAERYALEKGGRSGRVARQYVEQLALAR